MRVEVDERGYTHDGRFQIRLKHEEQVYYLLVHPTTKVLAVQMSVARGLSTSSPVKLFYEGKTLQPSENLAHYNVQPESQLFVLVSKWA